ncbi:MAG: MBL fold metallo-hydrolase, partial [Clostridia bacterium]|nr:MBL fold metallo-hydrolase [Clostridia bacterium]
MIRIPAFGETNVIKTQVNEGTAVYAFSDTEDTAFAAYCQLLEQNGYQQREARAAEGRQYAAYQKEDRGVFLTAYATTGELRIVTEEGCLYFSLSDTAGEARVVPQITQIALEDFGMSYVIRLPDGRFIVIDGGRNFEPDQDKLFARLCKDAEGDTPVIAAWIMTHPHDDHFHCFNGFMERYGHRVFIERFLLNFPEADDFEHYPKLAYDNKEAGSNGSCVDVPVMLAYMQGTGAPIYTPRTGQIYRVGDAVLEILSCMDDTVHVSQNINASALVIRMELGGQTVLWATDASFEWSKLPERYGTYLKSDILQIPHHGFQCGSADAEIAGYDYIRPRVCFLPASDYNAYAVFCTYRQGTRHLMTCDYVQEIITGDAERTVTLPYTPPGHAKEELRRKFRSGLDSAGARTWIFTGLST